MNKVIYLNECGICRKPAKGSFCKKHESFFIAWARRNALRKRAL